MIRNSVCGAVLLLVGCGHLTIEPNPTNDSSKSNETPTKAPSEESPPGYPEDLPEPPAGPGSLSAVAKARSLACTPAAVYAGTTDGHLFRVDATNGLTTEVLPAAGSAIGRLAYDGTSLFYTLPGVGEVHRRDADGTDETLASGLDSPTGIAASDADVFVGVPTRVVRLAKNGAAQVPETRVTLTGYWVGSTPVGISIVDGRLLIAHGMPQPGGNGGISYYTTTGTQLAQYPLMTDAVDVTASAAHLYWLEGGLFETAEAPLRTTGMTATPLNLQEYDVDGLCYAGGRLYYTALGPSDARSIKWFAAN